MINLILKDITFPLIRFLVMPQGHWTDSTQPWEILNQPPRRDVDDLDWPIGYELIRCSRRTLPAIGEAEFICQYGDIATDGIPYSDASDPRDLVGYHVRIQAAPYVASKDGQPAWRTIWLGTVDRQQDMPWNGPSTNGIRRYFATDLLFRTKNWPMNKHAVYANGTYFGHCQGHPGYNYRIDGFFRRLLGNRDASAGGGAAHQFDPLASSEAGKSIYDCHAWPGSSGSGLWSDDQVVIHALRSSRSKGEPYFTLKNPGNLQGDTYPWPVGDGDSCWEIINRVLSRQRGRGVSFLDWDDDTTTDDVIPNINPYITINPQNRDDISFTRPSTGGTTTITGAATQGTMANPLRDNQTFIVDLTGDHRFVDGSLTLNTNNGSGVDYLATQGERIETLVTLSGMDNTLEKRWSTADENTFKAISVWWQRTSTRWRHVFQRWSLPSAWNFEAGDGNGGTKTSCWYKTSDTGVIYAGTFDPTAPATSPLICKIGCDIPIYEGYNYASSPPVRYDGATDYLSNPRNAPLILIRSDVSNMFLNGAEYYGMGMQVDDFGVLVMYGPDQGNGNRYFSGPSSTTVGGVYDQTHLVISVGITFGDRVRMASANGSYTELTAGRRKYLTIPGACLWLAHPGAIWEHNINAATDKAAPAKRAAAGGSGTTPGILRDDRDALAVTHAYAWSWYGTKRVSASWALRDCGFMGSFEVNPSSDSAYQIPVYYPTIGQMVDKISASGQTYTIQTPITGVDYDHQQGVTTWSTDWQDLDTENL